MPAPPLVGPSACPIPAKLDSATVSAVMDTSTSIPDLAKTWKIREYGDLKFAWEVYNVTNAVGFDPASIGATYGGNLGIASTLLTTPRRMQFCLRFDF